MVSVSGRPPDATELECLGKNSSLREQQEQGPRLSIQEQKV